MSELPSLFIANSKISLFLKKKSPTWSSKKVHMYGVALTFEEGTWFLDVTYRFVL
jgi:predicted FMN-binding regulatory protein PaiB